nr:Sensor histidine kinase GlrK [Klebsiella pneumoniae]
MAGTQSLNALSARRRILTVPPVDARRSEAMINAALEMERSYRQYCVLDDPTLARVYQNQRQRYSQMLDAHAGVLPDESSGRRCVRMSAIWRSCSVK